MAKKSPKSDMTQTSMSKSPLPKSPVVKTSISKSSMPKSPMQKSPMPNSPMQKSPIYEKYKSRCAYGFFNFLRRRSKKLIADADRRRISRHALGDGCVKSGLNLHSDQCIDDEVEEKSLAVDSGNLKKNKIKGEDVSIKQQMKKKITTAKVEYVQSTSELVHDLSRNQRKATKTARKARRLPIYGCYDVSTVGNINSTDQSLADRSSKSLDSAVTAEVLPNQVSAKNEGDGICRSTNTVQCDQFNEINLQVNMSKATEAFINQKLIDGKHLCGGGVSHQSKHFLDALEILNSNKDLFIKLLQDPNSLLVKHIEDLRDCQVKDQQSEPFAKAVPEHQTINARESNLSKTKEISVHQPFENIVVLRPNRISHDSQIHCSLRNVQQSVKPAFFPFEQIKRKLMQTIGIRRKEKQLMLTDGAVHHKSTHDSGFDGCGKRTGVKIFTTNSPYKASYDFGGITTSSTTIKRKDRMNKVNEFDPGISEEAASANESGHEKTCLSTLRHPERNKHDENVKSRINISELRNGNKNFLKKQRAKSGDAISSVREYDFFPTVSSRGTREHDSVSPQMRFSAHSSHPTGDDSNRMNQKEYKKSCLSPPRQNQEAPPWAVNKKQLQTYEKISDNILYDVQEHIDISSSNNDLTEIETKYIENSKEISSSVVVSKPDGSCNDDVNQSTEALDACERNIPLVFSRMDSPVENQTSTIPVDDYSSSPLNSWSVGEFDRIKDNVEQPSPVSVLDQFYTEDMNSPLNVDFQPVLPSVRRLHIGIEEGCLAGIRFPLDVKINSSSSTEDYGSVIKYVTAVLQACCLEWDELMRKFHFSDQLLNQSLLDDLDVWPNQSRGDSRLLFDYINEVIVDVCQCYLRCSPWLSFIKPRILSKIITGSVLHEVMKNVDWNLLSAPPLQTLEKTIEKDGTWMDIRIDAEDIVREMVDSLVEELTIEIAIE